jgi:membrane protein
MKARLDALLKRWNASFPGRFANKFNADQAPNWAVIIAWNTLGSMFPILLVIVGVLGAALSFAGVKATVVYATVLSLIPADSGAQQETLRALETARHASGVFFLVGFLGLVWSGSSLFGSMEQAFDAIYGTGQRDFVRQKVMSVLMVLLFTVLAGAILLTSTLLGLLEHLPFLPSALLLHGGVAFALQVAFGLIAGCTLFLAIFYVVPNGKQEIRRVWPGALLAGFAFEALTLLFPLYIRLTGGSNQYGKTFGFLFLVLSLAYFVGLITMLGAELNSLLRLRAREKAPAAAPPADPGWGRRKLLPESTRPRPSKFKAALGLAAAALLPGARRRSVS